MIDYDVMLFSRRRAKHLEAEYHATLRELKNKGKLLQVFNVILNYGKSGITHKNLAERVELDRKPLRKYTMWLMEKGLIRRESHHGKYFPVSIPKERIYMSADILWEQFRDLSFPSAKRLGNFFSIPVAQRVYTLKDLHPEPLAEVNSEYIVPRTITDKPDKIDLERVLIDFSNTIGGFITYLLIQSMNPANVFTEHSEDHEEKGILIRKWINDVLSDLSDEILDLFMMHTELHDSRSPRANYSQHHDLILAFSDVYPGLYQELECILQKLPEEIKKVIDVFRLGEADKNLKSKKR